MSLAKRILKIGTQKFEEPNSIDKVLDKVFLWAFPTYVKPNHLTVFRYISTPFIFYLLFFQYYLIGFIAFFISAMTDALDGAMARTRGQITSWGKINDPLADKLLIGLVGAIMIIKYVSLEIIFIIIILEILTIAIVAFFYDAKENPGAMLPGKIKMALQSLGVGLIILYAMQGFPLYLSVAIVFLYLSILFSIINVLFCLFWGKSL